jgi:hypothetical protein
MIDEYATMNPYSTAQMPSTSNFTLLPLASNLVPNIPHPTKRIPPEFRYRLSNQHQPYSQRTRILSLTDSKKTPVNMTPTNICSIPF